MNISKYNSDKITILNGILIMMVLYIHSYYIEAEHYKTAHTIQQILGINGLMNVAVPLFFTVSGFLFFNGVKSVKGCMFKIIKRMKTLFIPYIVWNVLFVLWYVLLEIIPCISKFINSDVFSHFKNPIDSLIYLYIMPAGFHLWFLRDLLIFVALSPLIYLLIKHIKLYVILLALVCVYFFPFKGLLFFIIGSYVAQCSSLEILEKKINTKLVMFCIIMYLGLSFFVSINTLVYNVFFSIFFNIISIIAVWRGYDLIFTKVFFTKIRCFKKVCGYSFFIYLFHEPIFNIVKKIPFILFDKSELIIIIFFLINPVIMYFVSICIATFVKHLAPRTYSILVGNRLLNLY